MAMNSSGPISLGGATAGQSINLENGNSATAQVSLNDTAVRNLAGVASGAITMPTNFWGKSNIVNISYTFSSNTTNAALNLSSISGYSAGKSNITVTINSGVYVYSTSTGTPGLTISGGTTGDTLLIVNNGYIMGMGGQGGTGQGSAGLETPGLPGGTALSLGFGMSSCTINNSNGAAYIGGGGGGGGAVGGASGAGGGGGAGGANGGPQAAGSTYGAGGGPGSSGGQDSTGNYSGGGGGRIFPGTGGTGSSTYGAGGPGGGGGAGGGGGSTQAKNQPSTGGNGGSSNNSGGNGVSSGSAGAGGGGGWGASGGTSGGGRSGGSGGKAVELNGKTVTWTSGDTTRVWGSVS